MKNINLYLLLILCFALVACGGNKKPQQAIVFNPGASPEQVYDAEREAKLAAKKAAYAATENPLENLVPFEGKIKLTVMVPDENLTVDAAKLLESKMIQMVTMNGIGGLGGNPRYVIAPEVNLLKKEVTSTAPVRHLITYDITFYVADIILGTVFASSSIRATGVGESETLAFLAAFQDMKPTDSNFQQMLADAETKIVDYYRLHGKELINEAKMIAAKGEIAQAMALLGSIPAEVGDVYEKGIQLMDELLSKYLNKECSIALSQFQAALGSQQNGVNKEAMAYYAMIPANSKCKAEADKAYAAYKAQLSAEDARAWERESAKIKSDDEYRRLKTELEAKIQITGNKCLADQYKKNAAYNKLPWIRKVVHLGEHDPFDGANTSGEQC